MHRLTQMTINDFVRERDVAVIMFGAPEGEATMEQALEFAEVWADHAGKAAFGYVDAFEHVTPARTYGIRVLPTTLVLSRGKAVAKLEGRHPALRIGAALSSAGASHLAAA